jgi:hypothetical protein
MMGGMLYEPFFVEARQLLHIRRSMAWLLHEGKATA